MKLDNRWKASLTENITNELLKCSDYIELETLLGTQYA